MMNARKGFDFDLPDGEAAEKRLCDILSTTGKFEVKMDEKAIKTGNHFVEYECGDKPSGIAVTESAVWAVVHGEPERQLLLPVDFVKKIARWFYYIGGTVSGGDDDKVRGVLIPWDAFAPHTAANYGNFDSTSLKKVGCPF